MQDFRDGILYYFYTMAIIIPFPFPFVSLSSLLQTIDIIHIRKALSLYFTKYSFGNIIVNRIHVLYRIIHACALVYKSTRMLIHANIRIYTDSFFFLLEKFNSYSLYEIEVPKEHAFNFKY